MAIIFKKISVDVATENIFQSIVAKQYDTDSRFLTVQLTNEGENLVVDTTSTVVINALREDNEAKAFAGSVNEDGTVTVPITSWMLDLDGTVKCDISIYEAERKLTSTTFTISVEAASYAGNDITEDENYDVLVTLIAECQEIIDNASQLVITVDSELSAESENPAQNKAIANSLSNAVKGKVTGEILRIDDISPIPHSLKVKAESKNLIDFNQIQNVGYAEPTIVENGFRLVGGYYAGIKNISVLPNTKYYLSYTTDNISGTTKNVAVFADNNTSSKITSFTNGTGGYFDSGDCNMVMIAFYASASNTSGTVEFTNIQLEYGTQSTEYKPYVDVSDVTVRRSGKNLLDYTQIRNLSNGVATLIDNGFIVEGAYCRIANIPVTPNTDYYLSFTTECLVGNTKFVNVTRDGTYLANISNGLGKTFNSGNNTAININFYSSTSTESGKVKFTNLQLEPGTQQTEYEPYVPVTEATVSDDGTVEGLTSIYPNTVLVTNSENVTLECEYNRDLNKVINNIIDAVISLGGNV